MKLLHATKKIHLKCVFTKIMHDIRLSKANSFLGRALFWLLYLRIVFRKWEWIFHMMRTD